MTGSKEELDQREMVPHHTASEDAHCGGLERLSQPMMSKRLSRISRCNGRMGKCFRWPPIWRSQFVAWLIIWQMFGESTEGRGAPPVRYEALDGLDSPSYSSDPLLKALATRKAVCLTTER